MTLDTELAAAWSKEVMREHNPAFSIAVMRRIERALYLRALVMNIAVVSAVMLFFIIFAPGCCSGPSAQLGVAIKSPATRSPATRVARA